MDILLINPPMNLSLWESKLGSKLPPLGLATLAAYLRDNNITTKILDAGNQGLTINDVLEYINTHQPKYVGITSTTNMINDAANLAQHIKKLSPGIVTIIGGPHVSALPEETIEQFTSLDIGICGEGERTITEVIQKGVVDVSIKGIVFRDNKKIIKTQPRRMIDNLDELPYPAYDMLEGFPEQYRPTPNNYISLPVVSIVSSRGCPYKCTFCAQSVFGRQWRAFSIEYLVNMIEHLIEKYQIKEVCFYDDVFLIDKTKLKKFTRLLIERKLNIKWSCEGRIDQFDESLLNVMSKSGCWQISFGIESGSQSILNNYDKKISIDSIKKMIHATKKAGIRSRAYLIVGAPTDSTQTLRETEQLILNVPLDDIHISFYTPMPGSEAYNSAIGKTIKGDFSKIDQYKISEAIKGVDSQTLFNFMNRLYKKFYFHPERLWRYFCMAFNPHKTWHLINSLIIFIRLTVFTNKIKL